MILFLSTDLSLSIKTRTGYRAFGINVQIILTLSITVMVIKVLTTFKYIQLWNRGQVPTQTKIFELDTWSREELHKLQNEDGSIRPNLTLKDNYSYQKPPKSEVDHRINDSKSLLSQWRILEIRDELLYKKSQCRNWSIWSR